MKRLLIVLAFSVCSSFLKAQPYIDLVTVRSYVMPFTTKYPDAAGSKYTQWLTAQMDLPIKLKENYLIISPFFEWYSLGGSNRYLYGEAIPLAYIKQWKNKSWRTAFVFIPRLSYSDLKSPSTHPDIFQPGGAVLAIYEKKENLKYKFGVYYNSEYFGFFMIPLLGIDWNINDRWNLFGVLPGSMNLEYKACKFVYTGIAFRSITNSFRWLTDGYYKIEDNHLRLFADFYLSKHLVFNLEAGHSILRNYSLGIKNGSEKNEYDLYYKDGFVYKAELSWRIRLDEKKE